MYAFLLVLCSNSVLYVLWLPRYHHVLFKIEVSMRATAVRMIAQWFSVRELE